MVINMRFSSLCLFLLSTAWAGFAPSLAAAKICSPAGFCIERPSLLGHDLHGVWVARPERFYVVGRHGTALRWDSGQFEGSFGLAGGKALNAVYGLPAASGASETVFAVGEAGTALRFDGRSWQPLSTGVKDTLVAVWASDPSHVLVAGANGTLLRFDGRAFQAIPCGTKELLETVTGWGRSRAILTGRHGTLLQYDGSRCTPVQHGQSGRVSFSGAYGDSPSQIVVVGTPSLRFDGKTWKPDPSLEQASERAIAAPGQPPLAWRFSSTVRYDGKAWVPFWHDHPSVRAWAWLRPGQAVAVGGGGLVASVDEHEVSRLGGSAPQAGWHFGVWGSSADNLFVTDGAGLLWRFDGSAWELVKSGSKRRLMAIAGPGPSHAFAVGDGGTIVHYNGKTWTPQSSGSPANLRGICTPTPQTAWAVGERGTIL